MSKQDPLGWIESEDEQRRREGLTRALHVYGPAGPGAARDEMGNKLVNFGTNDYLGLAMDTRVVEAGIEAARQFGWGATASPLVCGWHKPHQDLAEAIARFEGAERALIFPTGYAANQGAVSALVGTGDAVYIDRLDHSCLVAGARQSGASFRVFQHSDVDALDGLLQRERSRFRRALIATDGVFSMDGDIAPLVQLAAVAERHEAILLVDEAHGTGVYGPTGRGACEATGTVERVHVRTGTLSKALGSLGGFVVGRDDLIAQILHRAATFVFSTALPPACAAAALKALEIVEREPQRRGWVLEHAGRLRRQLDAEGWNALAGDGPIVPVVVGEPDQAIALSSRLRARGLLVPAIRPPTVPRGTSRLRISVTAAHTGQDVAELLAAMSENRAG